MSTWSFVSPPNSQKQTKKGTKVKPSPKYASPSVLLYYREGFLMFYSMFNFVKTLQVDLMSNWSILVSSAHGTLYQSSIESSR